MPLREFQCSDCGHEQEHLISEGETPTCVHCDSTRLVRLVSSFGGYHVHGNNGSSIRPKGAGSRLKKSR